MKIALIDRHPEIADIVAELHADGAGQQAIADKLTEVGWEVRDRGTIREWLRRDDVQQKVDRIIKARTRRILRHTDSKIEGKLTSGDHSLEQLLKVRREFVGSTVNINQGDTAGVLAELMQAAHDDPKLAAALDKIMVSDAGDPGP